MAEQFSIKQAATLSGVSVDTLRYYERIGLLPSVVRAASGHRRYTALDLSWIDFLAQLRRAGMSIQQMQQFVQLHQDGATTAAQIHSLLVAHQHTIEERLRELIAHLAVVQHKLQYYHALEQQGKAQAIPRPTDAAMVERQRRLPHAAPDNEE